MMNHSKLANLLKLGLAHLISIPRRSRREQVGSRAGVTERARRAQVPAAPNPPPAPPKRPAAPGLSDEDSDVEMRGDSEVARARRRERARCKAILMSDVGLRNPALAQGLAFRTGMPRSEALATLAAVPAPRQSAYQRCAGEKSAADPAARVTSMLDSWDAARRRNEGVFR